MFNMILSINYKICINLHLDLCKYRGEMGHGGSRDINIRSLPLDVLSLIWMSILLSFVAIYLYFASII